jgi:hypothetical protein
LCVDIDLRWVASLGHRSIVYRLSVVHYRQQLDHSFVGIYHSK